MPKRKAESQLNDSPTKRRTRSSGPLTDTQIDDSALKRASPTKKRVATAEPKTPTKPRPRKRDISPKKSSLKENSDSDIQTESEDDILLTPATSRQNLSRVAHRKQLSSPKETTLVSAASDVPSVRTPTSRSPTKRITTSRSSGKRGASKSLPQFDPPVPARIPAASAQKHSSLRSPRGHSSSPPSSSLSPPQSESTTCVVSSQDRVLPQQTRSRSSRRSRNAAPPRARSSRSSSPQSVANAQDLLLEEVNSASEEEYATQDTEYPVTSSAVPSSDPCEPEDETILDVEEAEDLLTSPIPPPTSPSKKCRARRLVEESSETPLTRCLNAQKRAILASLSNAPAIAQDQDAEESEEGSRAFSQLSALLNASIERGETNSCLVIGARNSGKTKLVEDCISQCAGNLIVVRLSGWAQSDERQAIKEIGWQLNAQTGQKYDILDSGADGKDEEDEDQFWGDDPETQLPLVTPEMPPAHRISELISSLPKLPRPTVVVLEAIDLFALYGRQALLYCLFDMVQSSRPGGGRRGVTVIGVTNRIDTVTLFEKRVKSRFSGRVINVTPAPLDLWKAHVRSMLSPANVTCDVSKKSLREWNTQWTGVVEEFLENGEVSEMLSDTYALTADLSLLGRVLVEPVLGLDASSSHLQLSCDALKRAVRAQRTRDNTTQIHSLAYPAICLLIAFVHLRTSGHDSANFEMLFRSFNDQVNTSSSAPVQLNGASIGITRCSKGVLLNAFQTMISAGLLHATGSSNNVSKEFIKYKCTLTFAVIKRAVAATANANLVKWLGKNSRA